jgi:hypothetical protein
MIPRQLSAGLLAVLFVLALAMGLALGAQGTGRGGGSPLAFTVPSTGEPSSAPRVVVVARGVSPSYIYDSSSYSTIPSYMLVPLNGVQVALQNLNRGGTSYRERGPAVNIRTNASGIAYAAVSPGNYSVTISGSNFSLNTTASFVVNSTTTIRLELDSSANAVRAIYVVSPDSATGVEPDTMISASLEKQSAPRAGFAELMGYTSMPGGTGVAQLVVNATIIGSYLGMQGYWAVLSPSGSYLAYPTTGLMLFQFVPVLEVNASVS